MPRGSISARSPELDLVREGDISVQVIRPFDPPLPNDLRWGWYAKFGEDGRQQFVLASRPVELIRVHYTVRVDKAMLRNLEQRSTQNKSGVAVRGLARAENGHAATVSLTQQTLATLVKRAAHNDNRRMTDGPVRVAVKFLEPQTGTPPTCNTCHKTLDEHERVEITKHGSRNPQTNLWDENYLYQEAHYLCREAS